MKELRHEMILASAGSGKTYRLTDRYLKLLTLGVEPEKVIALTFTRKAAGEFFDAILRKLVEAISDEAKLKALAEGTGKADLSAEECLGMVRSLVSRLHVLRLGTLDSFLSAILRSFPFEHGLGGSFEMLDDHGIAQERKEVYRRVFDAAGQEEKGRGAFLEAFKQSTFGREERSLMRNLDAFVERYHRVFLWGPEADRWGNAKLIWPEGQPLLSNPPDAEGAGMRLRELLSKKDELKDKARAKWEEFIGEVEVLQPGGKMGGSLKTPVNNMFGAYEDIKGGRAEFNVERCKVEYGVEECCEIGILLDRILFCELKARVEATRGIWQVMDRYERQYRETVRRAGKLTFDDVQNILAGVIQAPGEEVTFDINFRLDGNFDHWLLDEFQDTSFAQWKAIRDLVDEVVQDTSGRRSFFYVGDVKQAIYGWRGGDSRLFKEVRDKYNQGLPGPIYEPEPMSKSWRSGPAVIEAVNGAFGDAERMAKLLPAATVARWEDSWGEPSAEHAERDGVVQILHPAEEVPDKEEGKHEIILALLEEIRPHERGLSCAVIVRRHADGKAIAEYIRAHSEVPVRVSADIPLGADNPVIAVLMSLLRFAAHPGDEYSWEHVAMSPLGGVIEAAGLGRDEVVREVLGDVHGEGFERVLDVWLERLQGAGEGLDEYSLLKVEELREASRVVDAAGNRDVMEFIEFVEAYRSSDPEAEGVVQVMTIHASKGLEYDMVILPGLDGKGMDQLRDLAVATKTNEEREVEWVLEFPTKQVWEQDGVLRAMVSGKQADLALENLCNLYVAMTRAIHANYIVTLEPKHTMNYAKYLVEMIGSELRTIEMGGVAAELSYETGNANWYEAIAVEAAEEEATAEASWAGEARGVRQFPRRARRLPSAAGEESAGRDAGRYFAAGRQAALDFGSAVHRLFEGIEWLEDGVGEAPWGSEVKLMVSDEVRERAAEDVGACLKDEAIAGVFRRSEWGGALAEVWRERAFEIVLGEDWVSGIFDRVVMERDGAGAVVRAMVVDFKTDRVVGEEGREAVAERYRGQVALYREVLGRMLGLEEGMIEGGLILTGARELVRL